MAGWSVHVNYPAHVRQHMHGEPLVCLPFRDGPELEQES
jgi:hypothetical protein